MTLKGYCTAGSRNRDVNIVDNAEVETLGRIEHAPNKRTALFYAMTNCWLVFKCVIDLIWLDFLTVFIMRYFAGADRRRTAEHDGGQYWWG
jgi:hypothetical protein